MSDKSARIAIGGVFSALCLLFMFLTAVLPLATFMAPMLAGVALLVVRIENGAKTALLVYVSVSLLAVFIVPDIDAKFLFIAFFGYYSALLPLFERIFPALLRWIIKLLVFNGAMVAWLAFNIIFFGAEAVVMQNGPFGQYVLPITFAGLNMMFVVYDFGLKSCSISYIGYFRPRFLKK